MHKILTYIFLSLALNSFSFWEMKTIYEDPTPSTPSGPIFTEAEVTDKNKEFSYCFLYDKHTHNQLAHRIYIKVEKVYNPQETEKSPEFYKENALKFLTADFNYDNDFWSEENIEKYSFSIFTISSLVHRKQQLIFNRDKTINKISELKPLRYLTLSSKIYLEEIFHSNSGVKIQNTKDGVILSKDNKNIDLSTALENHFVESVIPKEIGDTIAQAYESKDKAFSEKQYNSLLDPMFNRINRPALKRKDLNRLKTSTILTVWVLIPEKDSTGKTIESQMIGLAQDEKGQKFHWTTDLKEDISILMQYAVEA